MTERRWTGILAAATLLQLPGSLLLLTVLFGILKSGPEYFPNLCQVLGVLQPPQ
jgi:hypothetical protein